MLAHRILGGTQTAQRTAVLAGAADAYILNSPDDKETTVSQRFSRKAFVQQSLRSCCRSSPTLGRFAYRLSLVCSRPIWPPKAFRLIHSGSLSQVS